MHSLFTLDVNVELIKIKNYPKKINIGFQINNNSKYFGANSAKHST